VTSMETIRAFLIDSYRVLAGKPLLGESPYERSAQEVDARSAASRYSRGNVAMQDGRFASEDDLKREYDEVAKTVNRN
jgi:hypothetical protein